MDKLEDKLVSHTLDFPFALVAFGVPFQSPVTVNFRYCNDNGSQLLYIDSLTAVLEDGTIYNMEYLIEDTETEIYTFIMANIIKAKPHWDYEGVVESPYWFS